MSIFEPMAMADHFIIMVILFGSLKNHKICRNFLKAILIKKFGGGGETISVPPVPKS